MTAPTSLPSLLPTPADALVVAAVALAEVLLPPPFLDTVLLSTASLVIAVPVTVLAPLLSLPIVFVAAPEAENILVIVLEAAPEVFLPSVFVVAAADGEMVEITPPCIAAGADASITL